MINTTETKTATAGQNSGKYTEESAPEYVRSSSDSDEHDPEELEQVFAALACKRNSDGMAG